ncbi:MAG: glycosyltransferase, partial [candidate division Zixibacteria bacterium]|nr:glycosyltransferase [candidate division Zixibacteria bacterium]
AETSLESGDHQTAEQYISQAIRITADDPETLNNAAVLLHMRGDYVKAEQALTKALSLNPALTDAHVNLLSLEGILSLQTAPDESRRDAVLRSAGWVSNVAPDPARDELLTLNRTLRKDVLAAYANRYSSSSARILLHRPANGALKYLMDSWAEVLTVMGIPTRLLNWGEPTGVVFERFSPTVFVTVADPAFMHHLDNSYIQTYRTNRGLQVGHISTLEHRYEPCDFLVTFHLDPGRDEAFSGVDMPLLSLPFGINPMQHYMRPGREVWDFFFVGTNSHLKVRPTAEYLEPILRDYSGILAGVGWKVGLGELPIEQAALLYNFATIYPNYHLDSNFQTFNEITERAYIIPACGGFELTDSPVAMKELFAPDEMARADSPAQFREMFAHFLEHPDDRLSYVKKGMTKVYTRDTLFHRMDTFAAYLKLEARSQLPETVADRV